MEATAMTDSKKGLWTKALGLAAILGVVLGDAGAVLAGDPAGPRVEFRDDCAPPPKWW